MQDLLPWLDLSDSDCAEWQALALLEQQMGTTAPPGHVASAASAGDAIMRRAVQLLHACRWPQHALYATQLLHALRWPQAALQQLHCALACGTSAAARRDAKVAVMVRSLHFDTKCTYLHCLQAQHA